MKSPRKSQSKLKGTYHMKPLSQGLKDSSTAQGLAVVDEVNVAWIQLLYLVTTNKTKCFPTRTRNVYIDL